MKILIVDDVKEDLYLLESLLKGTGYQVVSARNGIEALDKLESNSIDVIISDILMPKMDGFQLCRECKRNKILRTIPFVFYTATYTDKKDEDFALSLGADRFIDKPQEPDVFLELLRDVIGSLGETNQVVPSGSTVDETVYLEEYNRRLVEKLNKKMLELKKENQERRQVEVELRKTSDALRVEHERLIEKNAALNQVLEHIEEARATYKHEISTSAEQMLKPFINKLKQNDGKLSPKDVDQLESTINAVIRKDIEEFKYNYATLSPREIEICELINAGHSSKQIAEEKRLSLLTVHKHRESIRRKLHIKNKNVNLSVYLRSK